MKYTKIKSQMTSAIRVLQMPIATFLVVLIFKYFYTYVILQNNFFLCAYQNTLKKHH